MLGENRMKQRKIIKLLNCLIIKEMKGKNKMNKNCLKSNSWKMKKALFKKN